MFEVNVDWNHKVIKTTIRLYNMSQDGGDGVIVRESAVT